MSAGSSPLQLSRAEKRQLLTRNLVVAVESILQAGHSYGELSVERLITSGNIARSTFYNYYDDKGDLLAAMAENVIHELLGGGRAWWAMEPGASKSDLHDALRPALETYQNHRSILGAMVEVASYDSRLRVQQMQLVSSVSVSLADHIRTWQAAGAMDASIEPVGTASWLVWMMERGLYQLVGPADPTQTEKLLTTLTDIVWRVLYVRVDGH